jgi:SAP domain-containing ribonucleoprotein
MKSRAERFGIAFNPNPTPTASKPKSKPTPAPAAASTPAVEKKEKVGAIDKAPLGISEEVLAKRAAKFGLPDKKEEKAPVAAAAAAAKAKAPEPAAKPKVEELTPYVYLLTMECS